MIRHLSIATILCLTAISNAYSNEFIGNAPDFASPNPNLGQFDQQTDLDFGFGFMGEGAETATVWITPLLKNYHAPTYDELSRLSDDPDTISPLGLNLGLDRLAELGRINHFVLQFLNLNPKFDAIVSVYCFDRHGASRNEYSQTLSISTNAVANWSSNHVIPELNSGGRHVESIWCAATSSIPILAWANRFSGSAYSGAEITPLHLKIGTK